MKKRVEEETGNVNKCLALGSMMGILGLGESVAN